MNLILLCAQVCHLVSESQQELPMVRCPGDPHQSISRRQELERDALLSCCSALPSSGNDCQIRSQKFPSDVCRGNNAGCRGNVNLLLHLQQQGLFAMETQEKEENHQHKHCVLCVCIFFKNETWKGHLQMKWNISYFLATYVTFPTTEEPLGAF